MPNLYHYEQSGTATFYINLVNTNGMPVNADPGQNTIITIKDLIGNTVLAPQNMTSIREGYYIYDWPIPNEQPIGEYNVLVTSIIGGIPRTINDKLNVVKKETEAYLVGSELPYVMSQRKIDLIGGLFYFIREAQEIPIRDEPARRVSEGSNIFNVTFGRWNQSALPEIRRNKSIVNTSLYSVDYNGKIEFSTTITPADNIEVSYNFQWFDMSELAEYIYLATQEINFTAPGTSYSVDQSPPMWDPAIIYGAAASALRRLIFGLAWQQPQLVYGMSSLQREGLTAAKDVFQSLLTSYAELFAEYKKQVKRARWPHGASIVVPEYTLPGGRSRWFRYLYKS